LRDRKRLTKSQGNESEAASNRKYTQKQKFEVTVYEKPAYLAKSIYPVVTEMGGEKNTKSDGIGHQLKKGGGESSSREILARNGRYRLKNERGGEGDNKRKAPASNVQKMGRKDGVWNSVWHSKEESSFNERMSC